MALKKAAKIFTVCLVTYVLIELVCFIFIRVKFTAAHFPQFKFQYNYTTYDFPIAEIDSVWGTWHYPETHVEKKQCFNSVYNINSYGARDKERSKNADTNRVICLGDSFLEGYGLNVDQRLTNLLENTTKKEFLNFGCGYFTPTQEYLLYKHLASRFSHNTVMLFLLPFNDLNEDDTSFHETDGFTHYQPYFQGKDGRYELVYRESELSRSTFNKQGYYKLQNTGKARTVRFLKEFTFWYNIYAFTRWNKPVNNERPFSAYHDCTEKQLNKLHFIIDKLREASPGKRLIIVSIPVYNDLVRSGSSTGTPFSTNITEYCRQRQLEYIDLLPHFQSKIKDGRDLYFSCDGHWNGFANKMAAEIILPLLRN